MDALVSSYGFLPHVCIYIVPTLKVPSSLTPKKNRSIPLIEDIIIWYCHSLKPKIHEDKSSGFV